MRLSHQSSERTPVWQVRKAFCRLYAAHGVPRFRRHPHAFSIFLKISIMENQMEKKMENEMETGLYWGNIGILFLSSITSKTVLDCLSTGPC